MAAGGMRVAGHAMETLLKKKNHDKGWTSDGEPRATAETHMVRKQSAQLSTQNSPRIKTKETVAVRENSIVTADGGRTEAVSGAGSEQQRIKIRESITQDAHVDTPLTLRDEMQPPRIRTREIAVHDIHANIEAAVPELPPPIRTQETVISAHPTHTAATVPSNKKVPIARVPIKTKDVYIQQQPATAPEQPSHTNVQKQQGATRKHGQRGAKETAISAKPAHTDSIPSSNGRVPLFRLPIKTKEVYIQQHPATASEQPSHTNVQRQQGFTRKHGQRDAKETVINAHLGHTADTTPSDRKMPLDQLSLSIKTKDIYVQQHPAAASEQPSHTNVQGRQRFTRNHDQTGAVGRTDTRPVSNGAVPQVMDSREAVSAVSARQDYVPSVRGHTPVHPVKRQLRQVVSNTSPERKNEKNIIKAARSVRRIPERTARHAIKTAEQSSGKTIKTAKRTTKAAARTAKATRNAQKTAQRTAQATRATAKATATTAKAAAKAVVVAAKWAVAAAQGLIAALTAGGGVVAAVVLVLCLAGLLLASPFGIFFADPGNAGGAVSPAQAVGRINQELADYLETLQTDEYDSVEVVGQPPDWAEVLAVFAVRMAGGDDADASYVAVLDAPRVAKLSETFWAMTKITTEVQEIEHPEADDTTAWTEKILTVTITPRTADDMRVFYSFSDEQNAQLDELLENRALLTKLAGDLTITAPEAKALLASLPEDLSSERRTVIEKALSLVGKVTYFWGGKSYVIGWDYRWGSIRQVTSPGSYTTGTYLPYGLDCSGFVDWVFYNASDGDYIIGHGGGAQAQRTYCTDISWEEAAPGDLVFYRNDTHVGIVGGWDEDGELLVVHCSNGVEITRNYGFIAIARPLWFSE